MIESCAEGLSRWRRTRQGGTHASITFAELVTEGFPLDTEAIHELLRAHQQLDQSPIVEKTETSRLLWGGPAAKQFAIEHTQPVAASQQQPNWIDKLNRRVARIDADLYSAITAALESAQRQAARAVGSRLANQIRRTPAPILAQLGPVDLEAGRPYRTWETTPAPIRAEANIDVQAAITAAADDLEDVVAELVTQAEQAVDEAIGEIADEPLPPEPTIAPAAAAYTSAAFTNWMLARYRNDNPADPEEQLETTERTSSPPDEIATQTLAVASGASIIAGVISRDELGQPITSDGVPTGGVTAGARAFRRLASSAFRSIRRLGLETVRPVIVYEWDYGPVSERFRPYEPHKRLDGTTWRMDDPEASIVRNPDDEPTDQQIGFRGHYPGDHFGCRCRPPKQTIVLETI